MGIQVRIWGPFDSKRKKKLKKEVVKLQFLLQSEEGLSVKVENPVKVYTTVNTEKEKAIIFILAECCMLTLSRSQKGIIADMFLDLFLGDEHSANIMVIDSATIVNKDQFHVTH